MNRSIALAAAFVSMTFAFAQAQRPGDADYPTTAPFARHQQKVAAVRAGTYDLVLIGDSITHTLQDFGGKYQPLTAVWNKHYAPRHAINLGHNGYRTEQILWNLENGELDFKTPPKVVMLLIGTNNTDDRHFKTVHTAEQVFAGTKAIVDLIRRRLPETKILILRIFPRGDDSQKGISPPVFNSSKTCIETCLRAGEMTSRLVAGHQPSLSSPRRHHQHGFALGFAASQPRRRGSLGTGRGTNPCETHGRQTHGGRTTKRDRRR